MYQSNLLSISKIENQSRIPGKLFQLTRCWTWNQMKGLMFGYWHEALHVSGVQHQDCENIEARGTDLRPSRVHCPIYKNISNIPSLSFPRLLQGQIKAAQLQPDVAFCSSKCERKSRAATDSEGSRHQAPCVLESFLLQRCLLWCYQSCIDQIWLFYNICFQFWEKLPK